MKRQFTARLAAILVLGLSLGLGACSNDSGKDTVDRAKESGTIKIAIAELLPYAAMNKNGDPDGYMIDVLRQILPEMGIEDFDATVTTFDAMIPGLVSKQFDMLPGGFSVTPERCEQVIFSDPVTVQQYALFVPEGNPEGIESLASIADADDVRVAVLKGSAQELWAVDQGIDRGRLEPVADSATGVEAVKNGRADLFFVGQFSVQDPEEKGLDVLVEDDSPVQAIGVAFRPDDTSLRDEFNSVLNDLRESGALGDMYEDWGFTNRDLLEESASVGAIEPACA